MSTGISDAGAVIPGSRKELAALRGRHGPAEPSETAIGPFLPPSRIDSLINRDWGKEAESAPATNVAFARAIAEHIAVSYRRAARLVERRSAKHGPVFLALRRYNQLSEAIQGIDVVDSVLRGDEIASEAFCIEPEGSIGEALKAWMDANLGHQSFVEQVANVFSVSDPESPFRELPSETGQKFAGLGFQSSASKFNFNAPRDVVCKALGYLMVGHDQFMHVRVLAVKRDMPTEGAPAWVCVTLRNGVRDDPVDGPEMFAPGRVLSVIETDVFPADSEACLAKVRSESSIAQQKRLDHGDIESIRHDNEIIIGIPLPNGLHLPLERLTDVDAESGGEHIRLQYGRLAKLADRLKRVPALRQATPQVRIGPAHRQDRQSITAEAFIRNFGFRGIQWGNYVKQSERQDFLNHGHDALMDLADMLGVPPRALSLGESLGIAFGARGRGGMKAPYAHYEPAERVINLTKGNGYGTLAHEWLHALDSHIGRALTGRSTKMLTELAEERWSPASQGQREVFVPIMDKLAVLTESSTLKRRSDKMDKKGRKPYYGTAVEIAARAFEGTVSAALQDSGRRNHLLVLFSSPENCPTAVWEDDPSAFSQNHSSSYPYPYPSELENGIRDTLADMVEAGVRLLSPAYGPFRQPFRAPQHRDDDQKPSVSSTMKPICGIDAPVIPWKMATQIEFQF